MPTTVKEEIMSLKEALREPTVHKEEEEEEDDDDDDDDETKESQTDDDPPPKLSRGCCGVGSCGDNTQVVDEIEIPPLNERLLEVERMLAEFSARNSRGNSSSISSLSNLSTTSSIRGGHNSSMYR